MLDRSKYLYDEVRSNWRDRYWWGNVTGHRLVAPIHQRLYEDGIDVVGETWDNLIVLDACRHDLFESAVDIETFDEYRTVRSKGSCTPEWTRRNFADEAHGDTVYVTANPWTSKIVPDNWYELESVWKDSFDDRRGTVLPEVVADQSRDSFDESKRLIAHFIQPHWPFYDQNGGDSIVPSNPQDVFEGVEGSPWRALANGNVDKQEVWEAYRKNLENVLDIAIKLARDLPGRSVITSDHGNVVGERPPFSPLPLYGHPGGLRNPELVEVPWAVINDERREHVDDGVHNSTVEETAELEQRLDDLGYM